MIIEIEGTDGSGKQTQSKKLFDRLTSLGYDVKLVSFPNYESEGCGAVKMYLRGEFGDDANLIDAYQSSSFFMVDRLTTMLKLQKELTSNSILICDRYVESNLIHQASKLDAEEQNKFATWLTATEYGVLKLPKPDVIIFLNMPPEASVRLANNRATLKTGDSKDIHENNASYLKKCYETGIKFAKELQWSIIDCCTKGNIKSADEIHDNVFEIVRNKLDEENMEK